jgi:hypothetical protein
LARGNSRSASAQALITMSLNEGITPSSGAEDLSLARASTARVMSMSAAR